MGVRYRGGVLTITAVRPARLTICVLSVAGHSPQMAAVTIHPPSRRRASIRNGLSTILRNPADQPRRAGLARRFLRAMRRRNRQVVTACSMELVNPPDGYVARFPNHNRRRRPQTGFGSLNSNQCAVGSAKLLAYQKAVYRNIAQMQSAAGLTPSCPIWRIPLVVRRRSGGQRHGVLRRRDGRRRPNRPRASASHLSLTTNDDPAVNSRRTRSFCATVCGIT